MKNTMQRYGNFRYLPNLLYIVFFLIYVSFRLIQKTTHKKDFYRETL